LDLNSLTLTEIIHIQNELSAHLARHYQKCQALLFTDIVGSTAYFSRFGNEVGRRLHQRHIDLINNSIQGIGGWIVDTAGDGAFLSFEHVSNALEFVSRFQSLRGAENLGIPPEHHIKTRTAIHWGTVLTDGKIVSGDPVNLCAKLVSATPSEQVYLSQSVFAELLTEQRLRCLPVEPILIPGLERAIEAFSYSYLDLDRYPQAILIQESGETFNLPQQPVTTFGRLKEYNGRKANDIVLTHGDPALTQHISRWHFEIRRMPTGLILRSLTVQPTEVCGKAIGRGEEAAITAGAIVRVSNVLTLQFLKHSHSTSTELEQPTTIY
jgi:class 3 adenylate cyclase